MNMINEIPSYRIAGEKSCVFNVLYELSKVEDTVDTHQKRIKRNKNKKNTGMWRDAWARVKKVSPLLIKIR